MKKIVKIAKGLYKALSILQVALIVCSAAAILLLLTAAIAAEGFVGLVNRTGGDLSFTSGILKVWPKDQALSAEDIRKFVIAVIIFIAIIAPFTLYTIRLIRGILNDMKEGRPFSQNIPARIRMLAYMIFIYAIITPVIPMVSSYVLFNIFNIQEILSASPLVAKIGTDLGYQINLLAIFAGFAVLLLSWVFEYGTKLQIESDETL